MTINEILVAMGGHEWWLHQRLDGPHWGWMSAITLPMTAEHFGMAFHLAQWLAGPDYSFRLVCVDDSIGVISLPRTM